MSIHPRVIAAALALLLISLLHGCCETAPRTAAVNEPRPLFDGHTLSGWQGLVGNPYSRAEMSSEQRLEAQAQADLHMRKHWRIDEATLIFDGHGSHLCTIESFGDFVLELEWMIEPGGDSGIYLRGSPQVQIRRALQQPAGSLAATRGCRSPARPVESLSYRDARGAGDGGPQWPARRRCGGARELLEEGFADSRSRSHRTAIPRQQAPVSEPDNPAIILDFESYSASEAVDSKNYLQTGPPPKRIASITVSKPFVFHC